MIAGGVVRRVRALALSPRRVLAATLLLMLGLGLAGCASPPLAADAVALPDDARAHPENYLVVTVRNEPAAITPYAASTARGYAGTGVYRAASSALDAARRVADAHGLRAVAAWPIELLGVHCLVYALPPAAQREQLLAALARDPDVESAQMLAQFELRTTAYNDPYGPLQSNLVDMGVLAAHAWSRGAGVRLALIDTGVDTAHPDFAGRIGAVRDFVHDGGAAAEAHGTAVAGVIAAAPDNGIGIAGIAPQATVLALRGCWSHGGGAGACDTLTLAQALAAAIDADARIVNLSLGGPQDPLLRRLVERGLARGIVFVGAVPASGRREGFPTGIDGVIAADVAGSGARQPRVLYAPGIDVYTLTPHGHYDVASGSSIASAEVSAVIALLLASRPQLTSAELVALLGASASPARSVNACRALRQLRPGAPPAMEYSAALPCLPQVALQ
ncbi:MAG: S8 family serine peptidase [Burkholderiales bacterium]|nr:S8 family serine peptidase [Burkholderiales bacterium]